MLRFSKLFTLVSLISSFQAFASASQTGGSPSSSAVIRNEQKKQMNNLKRTRTQQKQNKKTL